MFSNTSFKMSKPRYNSSGALNPAGIILKSNPAADQRGIISNGVKTSSKSPLHRWEGIHPVR